MWLSWASLARLARTWTYSKNVRYCLITAAAFLAVQIVLKMDTVDNRERPVGLVKVERGSGKDVGGGGVSTETLVREKLKEFENNVPAKIKKAKAKKSEEDSEVDQVISIRIGNIYLLLYCAHDENLMPGLLFVLEPLMAEIHTSLCNSHKKRRLDAGNKVFTAVVSRISSFPSQFVGGTVRMIDSFMKTNGNKDTLEKYNIIKSMIMLWNPEASKWATNASVTYRERMSLIDQKASWVPVENSPPKSDVESRIEQCDCVRRIPSTPYTDDEGDDLGSRPALNTSMCSEHSHDRGPNQRVI